MRKYKLSLFIFRRDLRIVDNSALNHALASSESVLPCFIFDPRQINKHPYQSPPALRFMQQSLMELQQALQELGAGLVLFHDLPVEVLKQAVQQHLIQAVFVNRDYTPFSRVRDGELSAACQHLGIDFQVVPDYLLLEPEQALRANGKPYQVFTAFYNNARQFTIPPPTSLAPGNFVKAEEYKNTIDLSTFPLPENAAECSIGGRNQALQILKSLGKRANYLAERDFPALDATTRLSAHLKFGTCSIREAYAAIAQYLNPDHPLLRQLYWRDFFTHIGYHFPYVFGKAFYTRYDKLVWDNNRDYFDRWANGLTGFPIVDAGMRELNATGFMHNRVRMITASFLTKDLHISWRWGERYFAQHLVDYDPCVNNGNWQWAASTGCDAQPYFRIFNPWLQQQKFDPECQYIHRWIPELKDIQSRIIHHWHLNQTACAYPAPMIDHAQESKIAKERYLKIAD